MFDDFEENDPSAWRAFVPLLPWALIALILSLIFSRWGYGWIPWTALGALIVVTLVYGLVRASMRK
jgi:hypothetical protein